MTTERELEEAAKEAAMYVARRLLSVAGPWRVSEPLEATIALRHDAGLENAMDALRALDAHRAAARDEALVERMKCAYHSKTCVGTPPVVAMRAVLALLEREGWKRP